ncbi:EAL domain-containing protein [Kineococcus auxinigenes]|uniref:EAL domain-containing protein n=1 Tax=unclassified Kineococcus TaxID=2621656 RepID=UPI003D7CCB17
MADDDAVAQLLDLARDIFGTPVAALARTGPSGRRPVVEQASSTLDPQVTARLLEQEDLLRAAPAVDVLRPDGTSGGLLLGVPADDAEPLGSRQLEALNVVAALVAGVLHHRDRRRDEHRGRLASLDALVEGRGRSTVLQPIVDLRTGSVVGAEALSRFTGEDGYPRGPEQVFADARSAGAGVRLERAALVSALALLPVLPAGAYLSVNASAEALMDAATREVLLASRPERIVVEVTEHDPVADYAALAEGTAALRAGGLRLAVDDAGSGFASLQHVLHLSPDVVKLDIAFVRGIDTDPARRAVARALVGFASEVGSTMVAEGVERAGELAALRELGVHCAQGYLLGRPAAPPLRLARPEDTTTLLLPAQPRDP